MTLGIGARLCHEEGVSSLGRVLDPARLDACDRARARLRVEVPAAWLREGADLELTAPLRLACARCDGGGCDGCGSSGALRAPADEADRRIEARLPALRDAPAGVALRIPEPFGPAHPVAQLLLEVRAGEEASSGVRRIPRPPAPLAPAPAALPGLHPLVVAAAVVVLALLAAIFTR